MDMNLKTFKKMTKMLEFIRFNSCTSLAKAQKSAGLDSQSRAKVMRIVNANKLTIKNTYRNGDKKKTVRITEEGLKFISLSNSLIQMLEKGDKKIGN